MADVLKKVPVREQDPKVRATNFDEVCLGYNKDEAVEEAGRCLDCKKAKCMEGCPVQIHIPDFIKAVKEGDFLAVRGAGAYGMAMASTYNSRPLCAEIMVDGDRVHVIRDRQSLEDLWRGEHLLNGE